MTAIRPLTGQLTGPAFLSCIDTEYHLHGWPLQAMILLDAAHPRTRAPALPDWKPVRTAPGFFSEGGLTATRFANAWLVVKQGGGLAQRTRLLRHLAAAVRL
jgi:hypothetical protein